MSRLLRRGPGVVPLPSSRLAVDVATTFPKLLAERAQRNGSGVAFREKRFGIWQPMTWDELQGRVRDFAHGLAAMGVQAGEVVAVVGDNRPEWVISELAAQSIGACALGVYPASVADEVVHLLAAGRVRVVIAEDQEQVDKVVESSERLPGVERVVYSDPRGLQFYARPGLVEFTAVEAMGRDWEGDHPGWLDRQVAAGHGSDIAVVCSTSGTTGRPKLAMLSHANLLDMGRGFLDADPIGPDDRYLSFLPLAWIGEQVVALSCGLQAGFTVSFPEEADSQKPDLRELGPSVIFSPPRIWEDMVASVMVGVGEAGRVKQCVFSWGYSAGERYAGALRSDFALRLRHRLAEWVVLRPVRARLGLANLRRGYTGSASVAPEVLRFFHAIGVNLKQVYGQTETCGVAVMHADGDVRVGTVGRPVAGTELRIADNGEILLRSASVFQGYYGAEAAGPEPIDPEGWLHTGDAGYLDEAGHLLVIGRLEELVPMRDGSSWSPAAIENKLKFSPYVDEAVVFRDPDSGITAMMTIDPSATGTWAGQQHLSYTTYTDLAGKGEVYDLIAGEVARANQDLPGTGRVQRFVLLHKPLDPDDDEITRTRKVRRRIIEERYAEIIRAMAAGVEIVSVHTTVAYQDGTRRPREVSLRIRSMDAVVPASHERQPISGAHS